MSKAGADPSPRQGRIEEKQENFINTYATVDRPDLAFRCCL